MKYTVQVLGIATASREFVIEAKDEGEAEGIAVSMANESAPDEFEYTEPSDFEANVVATNESDDSKVIRLLQQLGINISLEELMKAIEEIEKRQEKGAQSA